MSAEQQTHCFHGNIHTGPIELAVHFNESKIKNLKALDLKLQIDVLTSGSSWAAVFEPTTDSELKLTILDQEISLRKN